MNPIDRVLKEAQRWKVPVKFGPAPKNLYASHAGPYGSRIFWKTGAIYAPLVWRDAGFYEPGFYACALVHEISHVICGIKPSSILDELESPLLATDYEMCRRLKLPWTDWQNESLGDPCWSRLPLSNRRRMLRESRQHAELLGLLKKGKPTFKWASILQ